MKRKTLDAEAKTSKYVKIISFTEMSFFMKISYLNAMNELATQPKASEVMDLVEKKKGTPQRLIEHTVSKFAKTYKLYLQEGRYDVRTRYKNKIEGNRRDANARDTRVLVPYKGRVVPASLDNIWCNLFCVLGPLFEWISENRPMLTNDLNTERGLIPSKKDTSSIPSPEYYHPPRAVYRIHPRDSHSLYYDPINSGTHSVAIPHMFISSIHNFIPLGIM
jgi:hypothetical protein